MRVCQRHSRVASSLGLFLKFCLNLDLLLRQGPPLRGVFKLRLISLSPQLSSACSPSPSRPLTDDVSIARPLLAIAAKTPVHIRRRRFLALHTRARTSLSSVRASSARLSVDYRLFLLCIPLPLYWIFALPRSCVAHYQVRLFCSLSGYIPPFSSSAAPS